MLKSVHPVAAAAVVVVASLTASVRAVPLAFDTVTTVSPTGAAYVSPTNVTTAAFTAANNAGDVVGSITTYNGATSLGNRFFFFDGSSNTKTFIGFYDGLYQPTSGIAASSVNAVYGLNSAGVVVGNSNFYNNTAAAVAQHAWIYNPNTATVSTPAATVRVGLTDTVAGYTSTAIGRANSTAYGANVNGAAAGVSSRYNGLETSYFSGNLGADAWYYNPTTNLSIQINLTDAAHTSTTGVRNSSMSLSGGAINNNNKVYGSSVNYNGTSSSVGSDFWVYDGNTNITTPIAGLQTVATATTTGYINSVGTRNNTLGRINNNDIAVGTTSVYLGSTFQTQSAFAYNAATTTFRRLVPTDPQYTSSAGISNSSIVANLLNDNNDVVISSARYSGTAGLGRDAVLYNYTTDTYKTVSPTGGNFVNVLGSRTGTATHLSGVGDVAGTAAYYNTNATTASGNRPFYYNAANNTTVITGRSGSDNGVAYADVNGAETSSISVISNGGLVAGVTQRGGGQALQFGVNGVYGQDAWVYNADNGLTSKLQGYVNGVSWAFSAVTAIADNDIAVGYFSKSESNSSTADLAAFAWTPANGFVELGLTVLPSLSAKGWQSLARGLYVRPDGTIYALGLPNGFASTSTGIAELSSGITLPSAYYTGAGGGSLTSASNFSSNLAGTLAAAVAPGVYTDVYFGSGNASSSALNNALIGSNLTLNSLTFGTGTSSIAPVTINGNGTITLNAINISYPTGTGIVVNGAGGSYTINAKLALGSNQSWVNNSTSAFAVAGTIDLGGRTLTLAGTNAGGIGISGAISGTGGIAVTASGVVSLLGPNSYTGGTVVNTATGTLRASPAAATTMLDSNGAGTNLLNGSIEFLYTGVSTATDFRTLLRTELIDVVTPGVLDTGVLRSSTATVARGIGYRDTGMSVIVKNAYFGDADLDGGVSINDFNALVANFGEGTGKFWVDGDFDYDGGVSINDFNLLAGNFGKSLPAASEAWAGLLAFAAAHDDMAAFAAITGVPEPTSLALLGLPAAALLRRRRA